MEEAKMQALFNSGFVESQEARSGLGGTEKKEK